MATRDNMKHSYYCDSTNNLPCNCYGNIRFDPTIEHGKGGCYCDYSSGLMEDSCGCCGAKSGEPCVIGVPSQAVDSPTKSENSIVESMHFLKKRIEALESDVKTLKAKHSVEWNLCQFCRKVPTSETAPCCPDCQPPDVAIYDGYTRKILVCSQHMPCCELRGLKRKYNVCAGSTPSRVTTCNCHKGRP
jgi:hypothetical protein